jgi:hypothetical protein
MGCCAVARTCCAREDTRWQEKSDGMCPRASCGRPALSPNQNPCRFARQRLCYGISDNSQDGEALPPARFTNDRFLERSFVDHVSPAHFSPSAPGGPRTRWGSGHQQPRQRLRGTQHGVMPRLQRMPDGVETLGRAPLMRFRGIDTARAADHHGAPGLLPKCVQLHGRFQGRTGMEGVAR